MRERDFLHKLRRGLGSAIIELRENPNRKKYYDIVLRYCLKDIGYDTQVEGTKGHYLYTAICALDEKAAFEGILIDTFMKRLPHRLFQQLADILWMYADEGSMMSKAALNDKYQVLVKQLPKQRAFPFRYCEREQFEYLMICQIDAGKWPAFKKCIDDAGAIIAARKDDYCSCYDWFICHSENLFGKKRVWDYLEVASVTSASVKAFVDAHAELEQVREKNSRLRVEPEVTLNSYIARARELEDDQYAYARMRIAAMRFSKQATSDDFHELVNVIAAEPSDEIKANLLRVFRDVDFPTNLDCLIYYAGSECQRLRDISIDALKRFKDGRVHDLAVKLIESGDLESGLPLLISNWRKADEPLLRQKILASKKVTHSVQMDVRDLYAKRRSNACGDILEHVYENGECSFCRSGIVEAMVKNRVLSETVLQECRFDSYDDTRKYAEQLIKRKKKSINLS